MSRPNPHQFEGYEVLHSDRHDTYRLRVNFNLLVILLFIIYLLMRR